MPAHVLLVEDDAEGRDALAALLRFWGYAVDVAETGRQALELAARCPAIVVLDIGLPDMTGAAVTVAMKALPVPPFIVAYTGFHRLEAETHAAGCDGFVLKPGIEALRAVLATATLIPARAKKVSGDAG